VRIVLDANVLVASVLSETGASAELLDLWRDGEFELVVSEHLLEEVSEALFEKQLDKFKIDPDDVVAFIEQLRSEAVSQSDLASPPRHVPGDAGDDYLVDMAIRSEADMIVTFDQRLLETRLPVFLAKPASALALIRQTG
jgi:putative PIN family toxin of toxin-antitoxin system